MVPLRFGEFEAEFDPVAGWLRRVRCGGVEMVRAIYGAVRDAAKIARLTPAQFTRLFKSVAGMTFVAYLTHLRLTNSLRLLKETDDTIAEIAAAVGFADQSYFDKRFKKSYGQSPRDFRGERRTA